MIIIIPCNVYLFFFSSIVLSLINLYLFHVYRYPYKKKYMWTYALSISGYIQNRCFHKRTACTPYELFTGMKPNIRNKAPFGSKCFVVVDKHKSKLDDRSYEVTLIG